MQNWDIQSGATDKEKEILAGFSALAQDLLANRGVKSIDEANLFLHPKYEDLHDPFLIKNMDVAVKRILRAIEANEKIVVYGDYDCDGIPGSVILHDFFKEIGFENFQVYIPHRYKEGYGLNIAAVESLAAEGARLLITVDNGITDVKEAARAGELGVDVIITDHHLPQEVLPPAVAVLNSKQEDDHYPFDMLSGAGVAFKLVQALLSSGNFKVREGWEKWLLDVVGISTIADMVPLRGENRALAIFGLKVLQITPRPGLRDLFRKKRINSKFITEEDVGFTIAPRINAASRMGDPIQGFYFLATRDDSAAGALVDYLEDKNEQRKKAVKDIMSRAEERIANIATTSDVIVLGDKEWLPGVVGLAATRIAENYNKPTFVWGKLGAPEAKGSCRSDGVVNMVDLMTEASRAFIDFGGHEFAGGFSVADHMLDNLTGILSDSYKKIKNKISGTKNSLRIERRLLLDEVNNDTYKSVRMVGPFGIGNPRPAFLFEGIEIFGVRQFGKNKEHLSLEFRKSRGGTISAIQFFASPENYSGIVEPGRFIDLVAYLDEDFFGRSPCLRLRIADIKPAWA